MLRQALGIAEIHERLVRLKAYLEDLEQRRQSFEEPFRKRVGVRGYLTGGQKKTVCDCRCAVALSGTRCVQHFTHMNSHGVADFILGQQQS